MKYGVVYFCQGSRNYFNELLYSAKSLKKLNPEIKTAVFTDKVLKTKNLFDFVFPIDNQLHPLQNKVAALINTPFKKTLYLDVDTKVEKSLSNIFELLEEKNLWMAHGPDIDFGHKPPLFKGFRKEDKLNTGLILYNKQQGVVGFFKKWLQEFSLVKTENIKLGRLDDQTLFNELIKSEKIEISILDNTVYNVRYWNFKHMNESQKCNIAIKHWHLQNHPKLFIKLQEYYYFCLNTLFGMNKEQIM